MSLEARGIGVQFDGDWVFKDVSFSISGGDRIALVGPSGSGKSLLLRSMAKLQPLSSGQIEWNGDLVDGGDVPAFRAEVMYLPQRAADVDGTVADFLKIPFSFTAHAEKRFDLDAALKLLSLLGREGRFLQKQQRELSGGERQIASLVRAVLLSPTVLLLDEPTSAMDGTTAAAAETLVSGWATELQHRAFVWVTHDLQQAERVASKEIVLDDLVQNGK